MEEQHSWLHSTEEMKANQRAVTYPRSDKVRSLVPHRIQHSAVKICTLVISGGQDGG